MHYEKFQDGSVKCIEDEIPFELPEGWTWCHYSDVINLYSGQDLTPDRYNDTGEGIPYITGASNLEHGKVIINRWTTTPTTHATTGDLLLTVKGSGVGKMAFCDIIDAHIARQIMALRCKSAIIPQYLHISISAMLNDITAQANGIIPGIRREIVLGAYLPLPPISEQEKICKSADNSLRIIDNISTNKDDLKEIIQTTKSKILDLAIRGKLVPQDTNDEPASVLLERIRAEKEEFIKQGKIKRDKKESIIYKGEDNSYYATIEGTSVAISEYLGFELPLGWTWITLGDIALVTSGKTPKSIQLSISGEVPYFKVADMNVQGNELYMQHSDNYVNESYSGPIFEKGSFIFPKNGGAVLTNKKRILLQPSVVDLNTGVFTPSHLIDSKFAFYLFTSIDFSKIYKGAVIPTVDSSVIRNLIYAMPPLEEQKRIASAITTIFTKIEKIENALF